MTKYDKIMKLRTLRLRNNAGLEKNPVRSSGTSRFPFGQVTFSPYLPHRQGPRQAVRRLNFWWRFWEEKVNFRLKGNQVFRWSLTKITIYSVVLLIAWRALTAHKWLPSTWSKSAPIKFPSRIKSSRVGHENAVFISLNFSNFLEAFSSFSVQNLTQQRYIKAVEIVREKKSHISTAKKKPAFLMLKSR